MEKLVRILSSINPDVDYASASGLVKDRILTSLELIMLITEICDQFDIEISPELITPENFDSADTILQLIRTIQNGE